MPPSLNCTSCDYEVPPPDGLTACPECGLSTEEFFRALNNQAREIGSTRVNEPSSPQFERAIRIAANVSIAGCIMLALLSVVLSASAGSYPNRPSFLNPSLIAYGLTASLLAVVFASAVAIFLMHIHSKAYASLALSAAALIACTVGWALRAEPVSSAALLWISLDAIVLFDRKKRRIPDENSSPIDKAIRKVIIASLIAASVIIGVHYPSRGVYGVMFFIGIAGMIGSAYTVSRQLERRNRVEEIRRQIAYATSNLKNTPKHASIEPQAQQPQAEVTR